VGRAPAAGTQGIRALEKSVGSQVLHRATRQISLSSDGEVLLGHAKRIIGHVEEAMSELHSDPAAIRGDLRVACSASFGRIHIAPYVGRFLKAHPNLRLDLDLSDSVVDIIEQGMDMAIRIGAPGPSALVARKIGASPRILVAAPAYLERAGRPKTLADLKAHNCLARGDVRTWALMTLSKPSQDIKIAGNFASTRDGALTEAAVSGLGIGRKCRWEIADHLDAGRLERVLPSYVAAPAWDIFAMRSPSPLPPARVRVFTDFLEGLFRTIPAIATGHARWEA